jgi:hypothetical protein
MSNKETTMNEADRQRHLELQRQIKAGDLPKAKGTLLDLIRAQIPTTPEEVAEEEAYQKANPVKMPDGAAERIRERLHEKMDEMVRTWTLCPTCAMPIKPDRTHNGVAEVWHAVHCGWGHELPKPMMTEREAWKAACIIQAEALQELAKIAVDLDGMITCSGSCPAHGGGHCKCGMEQDHADILARLNQSSEVQRAWELAKNGSNP